jgi:hypothetical protein
LSEVLLIIPPLTQLNTPYPATAYLSGFLKKQGVTVNQCDLGLDLVLNIFTKQGLSGIFQEIELKKFKLNNQLSSIFHNRFVYIETIDAVVAFLQNKNYTLAYRIAAGQFLPVGPRFNTLEEHTLFFGSIGTQDKARYLCTMYLEDLGDLIQATVGPQFGFSKYAERIAQTAVSFDPIREELERSNSYLDQLLWSATAAYFESSSPSIVGLTVPFPGNLYGALKIAQWIKANSPQTKIVLGGGYANTELRELSDPTVFDYVDFITLDDGEAPIMALIQHIQHPESHPFLKRTYRRKNDKVEYVNNLIGGDFTHQRLPAPSYAGLRLKDYLSMYDVPNPMHRLWNDGRWNKLTIAHGCYWKKCSFCDISLDYISRFDQAPAKELVDKMEALISETGETGFHFVDEAAPPLAMRDLAIEIISRGLQVTWWTNIRFEKTFTPDLCKLLAASGCIAVTGGLEVASERLLLLMEKGITIEQVAKVCQGFRDAGILVHAYLMYGFPTETEQETIDSLEIVRQLFQHGLLQSAFWHRFAMTVHSPVGLYPEKYNVIRTGPEFKGFANNDLHHEDPTGADHSKFSDGLKKALYNYMHNKGLDFPLRDFFDFLVPHTEVPSKLIGKYLKRVIYDQPATTGYRLMWNRMHMHTSKAPGKKAIMTFTSKTSSQSIEFPIPIADYIENNQAQFEVTSSSILRTNEVIQNFATLTNTTPEQVVASDWYNQLRRILWSIKN